MSVDVEDYLHTWALSSVIKRDAWDRWPSRVEAATMNIIEMFERENVRATFFVLGWVAKRAPLLIREIVARGHELASHGYHHEKVHDLTPQAFFDDVRDTRLLLEDLSGADVKGFRAPSFSINKGCWWAYDQLKNAGYRYSSSLHPISHDHYGMPDAPLQPFHPADHDLIEIPVATIELAGRRVSCAGGGHFRLLPYHWSRWCLGRLAAEPSRIATFYFHPWEIDPAQPRIPGLPLKSRLRQYRGLSAMKDKLTRLLKDFGWDRVDRLFGLDRDVTAVSL
jgi:polysaccharide deacetylase family protein (PEP-CTERM system associated)